MDKKEKCLSLCEVLISTYQKDSQYESIIASMCNNAGYDTLSRIYIGSNFCSQYFLNCKIDIVQPLIEFCEKNNVKVTLCLPIFSEKDIDKAKERINYVINNYDDIVDEFTVNDYGMLDYISSEYSNVKINIGRLFNKESRDARYVDYNKGVYSPNLLSVKKSFLEQYNINSIEIDPVHQVIDLSESVNQDTMVAVYTPFCYVTMGHICEYASIPLPLDKKFRPNTHCHAPCANTFITYDVKEFSYVKVGRAVYFRQDDIKLVNANKYREIYQPFDVFGVSI